MFNHEEQRTSRYHHKSAHGTRRSLDVRSKKHRGKLSQLDSKSNPLASRAWLIKASSESSDPLRASLRQSNLQEYADQSGTCGVLRLGGGLDRPPTNFNTTDCSSPVPRPKPCCTSTTITRARDSFRGAFSDLFVRQALLLPLQRAFNLFFALGCTSDWVRKLCSSNLIPA